MVNDKILIIDDDKTIVDFLSIFLMREGYGISISHNGIDALEKIRESQYRLILLDIMMPKMDGYEFIKKLREFSCIPVIFLTAKANLNDKIKGFISGCDDYITKPFDLTELSLRISAVMKRTVKDENEGSSDIIRVKDLHINVKQHSLHKENKEIKLTPKEFSILVLLAKNKARVFSSSEIYEKIWEAEFLESDNSVLTHIRNLREKLGDTLKNSKYIKTVWGVGYKIDK